MNHPSIVVFAWDGVQTTFEQIEWDAKPKFKVLLFNFSGNGNTPTFKGNAYFDELLSIQTEFKGRLIKAVHEHLKNAAPFTYIGFVDDDLKLSISGINTMLEIAAAEKLDAFQPATTEKSFDSHAFTKQIPGLSFQKTDWVEIMCPFYRREIFDAAAIYYTDNITSYGIDIYVMPYVQKMLEMDHVAVIHEVPVTHLKPVTDGDKRFSNGLTSREEGEVLRTAILSSILKDHRPIFDDAFLKRVYEYKTLRFNKIKRDLKRWLGLKAK